MRIHPTPPTLDFYELFTSLAETVRLGAEQYLNLLKDFTEVPTKIDEIIGTEHRGDQVTREIMRANATTFVSPFDSGDISGLASGLDTALDHIEAAADCSCTRRSLTLTFVTTSMRLHAMELCSKR